MNNKDVMKNTNDEGGYETLVKELTENFGSELVTLHSTGNAVVNFLESQKSDAEEE